MTSADMSSCLHLALTSKFKPGAEEALQKLGAKLHKNLSRQIEGEQAGLVEEASANFDMAQIQEDNTQLKLELENLRTGMAYAKSQFLNLKADRDAKAAEAANVIEQLNEVERVRLALEESKQQSDASLTLLGSEITSLKENNAALLENLQELQEKEIELGTTLQDSQDEIEALRQASDGTAALASNVDILTDKLATKDAEIASLKDVLGSKEEEIVCLTTELDEQLVDIDKLNDDLTKMSLETKSAKDQFLRSEEAAASLTQQLAEAAQEKLLLDESFNKANEEKDAAIQEKDALEAKMRYAKGQFDKMKKLLEDRGKQLAELKDVHQDLQAARADIDRLTLQLSSEEGKSNEELSGRIRLLESESQFIRESLDESNADRQNLEADLTEATSQLAASEAQLNILRAELEGYASNAQQLMEERNLSTNEIESLRDDIELMQGERNNSSLLHSQLENTIAQLTQDLAERDTVLEVSSNRVASLEARLEDLAKIEDELRSARVELERAGNDAHHLMGTISDRDNEFARQTKELEDLQAEFSEIPQIRKSLADTQAQLDGLLPQYHSLEKDLSDSHAHISELQTAAQASEQRLQDVLKKLAATEDENSHIQASLKTTQASVIDKEVVNERLRADLEEACSLAELADTEIQQAVEEKRKMEEDVHEMQIMLRELQDQLSTKDEEVSTLEVEIARIRPSLESHTKTELELQSTKLRFGVCEEELHNLRQEVQHHKAARNRLSELEESFASAESENFSLVKQLDEHRVKIEQLSRAEEQLQSTFGELADANSQISLLQQKVADSDSCIKRLQAEQEQGNESLYAFELKSQQLQDHLYILQEEVAQNQNRDVGSADREEEVVGLRQQIMQLETALAVSGSQNAFPSLLASDDRSDGREVSQGKSESMLQTEVDSLSNKLVEAQDKENSLLEEIFGLRTTLESERRLRSESHSILDEPPMSGPGSVMINMDGITNKKDEDIHDIEATVLSGGDTSGFQPIAGLIRGMIPMKYMKPCIEGSDFVDRGFIVLMRQPALRIMLMAYFMLLHMIVFLFGAT